MYNKKRIASLNSSFESFDCTVLYSTTNEKKGEDMYNLYKRDEVKGIVYIGSFLYDPKHVHKYIEYHLGTACTTEAGLISAMEKYNETRTFPSWFYDPTSRKGYLMRQLVRWYMEKIGFELSKNVFSNSNSDVYTINGAYGNVREKISVNVLDMDKANGKIVKDLEGYSWIESEFIDEYDFIAKINSFIEPIFLLEATKGMEIISKMGSARNYSNISKVDASNMFNIKVNSIKEDLKNKLRAALESLED